jgi:LuxR family maltose regulon positive regulatory protein
VVEVRQDDLRFTPEEATAFLNEIMGLDLPVEAVTALEARTEGWIAGLQLAALSLQGRGATDKSDFILAFSGTHRYIIDYLVEEVVQQQPRNIRQFLRQTSILNRFSVPLCNAVTGLEDSQLILNYLDQVNLFLIPLDDRRQWYRYHHLFAEFLQTELTPAEHKDLHCRAARWFEANHLLREAIHHALAAKEFTQAGQPIVSAADSALRRGAMVTVGGWLAALPEAAIRHNAELAIYKGWVVWMQGDVDNALFYAQLAAETLPPDAPGPIRGKLISLQACLTVTRAADGLALARQALPLLEDDDSFFAGMTLLVLAEALNLAGETAKAVETLTQALRLGQKHDDDFLKIGALTNLAQQLNWQGKRREAEALCRQAVQDSHDDKGGLLPMAGFAYITLAEIEYYSGDLQATSAHLRQGIKLIEKYAMSSFIISAKLVQAPLLDALGQTQAAVETMREILRVVQTGNFDSYLGVTAAMTALYQMKAGYHEEVEQWAASIRLPAADEPLALMREFELSCYARYLLAVGRLAEAETLLTRLIESTRSGGRLLVLLELYLVQAGLYSVLGPPQAAHMGLALALSLGQPEGYYQVFLQEGPEVLALLPAVREQAPAFVDAVLALAGQRGLLAPQPAAILPVSAPSAAGGQSLVEPLSERELEVLQLIANGQSNKEASTTLYVTVGTVKKHLSNIFGKLDVTSRTQAIARAASWD